MSKNDKQGKWHFNCSGKNRPIPSQNAANNEAKAVKIVC